MKKVLFLAVASALAASFAFGALGDIVASFQAPADWPIALAVPPNYHEWLWVFCLARGYCIYRVSGNTGSLYSSFTSPFAHYTRGLTYSRDGGGGLPGGNYLWIGNQYYVNRCDYNTGSVYASFPAYAFQGLAVKATGDGGRTPSCMLVGCNLGWRIYHYNLVTGSILMSYMTPVQPYDIAWDWRNELIWTGYEGSVVYGLDTSGSVVTSFTFPAEDPQGFAYTSNYLWVSNVKGRPSHYIWKIHCPKFRNPDVAPASLGKIRATYR
jgi:hypothetical protein